MVEFKQSTLDSLSRSEQDDRDQLPSLVNPQARKPAATPGADVRFKAQTLGSLTRSEPSPLPNVLNDALTRNPDKFSQDKKVGKTFNLPPSAAENDDGTLALNARSLELQRALAESPYTKQWFSTPDNAKLAHDDVDNLTGVERAASSVYNYGANLAAGVGESFFNRIVGGSTRFVGTLADDLADYLDTNVIDLGRIEYDFTGEGPLLRWRPSTEEDIAQDSPLLKYAEDFEAVNLGYKAATTWDDFLENPAVNFLPFALETGLVSLPDMVATLQNLPAYVAARSGDIGQARAENDGRVTATTGDLFNAMPYAVSAALLERIGAKGVFGLGTDALRGRGALAVAGATGRAALKESITEGVQEPLEYAGETIGTAAGFQLDEAAQRALQGFVVGSGFGGSIRAGTATLESRAKSNAARRRAGMMQELNNQESKLRDRDPAVWAEFQAGLMEENGVEAVVISEEGVGILQQAIEALPADQRPVINTDGFSSLGATVSPKDFWSLPKDTIDALAEHVAFDVNQPSAAEAEEIANLTETLSQDDFIAEVEETISTLDERDTLTADIEQQIMETGGALSADPANARAAARQMAAAFTTLARRSGMTVEQVRARFPVRVERAMGDGRPAAGELTQGALRSAWDKLRGKDTSPNVVTLRHGGPKLEGDRLEVARTGTETRAPGVYFDTTGGRQSEVFSVGGRLYEARLPAESLAGVVDAELDLTDVSPEIRQALVNLAAEAGLSLDPDAQALPRVGSVTDVIRDRLENGAERLIEAGISGQQRPSVNEMVIWDQQLLDSAELFDITEGAPIQLRQDSLLEEDGDHPLRIATRQPTRDTGEDKPTIGLDTIRDDAVYMAKMRAAIDSYPNFRADENETDGESVERYIEEVKRNLLWLHDTYGDDYRERGSQWYDGARRITEAWMQRYGLEDTQIAGVLAALSPQMDWFTNVSLGERVIDTFLYGQDISWDTEMQATMDRIFPEVITDKDGNPVLDKKGNVKGYADLRPQIEGKTLAELGDGTPAGDALQAAWIRVYDETNNSRWYAGITPEGGLTESPTNADGSKKARRWGGLRDISKAISILRDPSPENISASLGSQHKVRNFYNNILAPNNPHGDVTIDTHAVAAAQLRPLGGSAPAVSQNLSGPPKSAPLGAVGTYAIHAEAYRRAAEDRGILARQMQSITWEAVRTLFTDTFKTKANISKIDDVWQEYTDGTITEDEARNQIEALAGGVGAPFWADIGPGDTVNAEDRNATYEGKLSAAERGEEAIRPGRAGDTGRPELEQQAAGTGALFQEVDFVGDVIFEVAPDPNNVELSSRWNALPAEVKLSISDAVSKSVLPAVLRAAGADGSVFSQIGSYLDDTNPSFSLRLTSGDPAAVARAVGFVLSQDSMVSLSADAFDGSFEAGAIRIQVGDKNLQEIDAIYQTLRGIEGFPQIGGQSTTDGQMTLILDEGVDVAAFADAVVKALPSEYNNSVLFDTVNVSFPEKEDYDYASPENDPAGAEGVARQRYRAVRDQASREVASAIDRYEQGGQQPALAQQRRGAAPRGSIDLRNAQGIIVRLYDAENLSTFLHESGHLYLEMLGSLAQDADAPQQIKDDFATVLDWLGVQSREQIGREQHERWAETYEQYLREGTAPSEDLRSAFAKFTAWLGTIYRQIKQAAQLPRAALTPEITGVMDRILATDEEIAVVRDEMRMAPLFKDAEVAGMSEEEYAEYRQRHEDAREAQREELTRAAFAEIRREKTKWWREALAKETKRILNVLDQDPVWRARSIIQRGTLPSGAPAPEVYPERLKLSKAATEEYGYTLPGGNQMFARDGVTPERAAQDLGYPSADQMLRELSEMPKSEDGKFLTAQQYAERQAKEFLEQEHGNLMDPDEMHEEALLKVHSRRQAEVILDELRTLNRISGRTDRVSNAAAREAARRTIEAQTVSKIQSPTKYLNAERRFAMKAAEAVIAGDLDAARRYKTQQLLNFHMYRHARDARQKADTMIARLAKYNRQKMDPKNIHPEFIRQVKELISDINFSGRISAARQSRLSAETLQAWADQQSEKFGASFHISPELDRALTKKNIRDFTYTELVGLHDTAKSIVTQGRRYSDAEGAQFQQLVRNIGDSVDANAKKAVPGGFRKTKLYKAKRFVRLAFAEHRSILNLSEELDGYELGGPVYTEVFQRLKRADDAYIDRSMQAAKAVNEILKAYSRREKVGLFDKKHIPEIGEGWTLNERLAFGLNLGNAGNVEALKETFSDDQIDAIVATLSDKDWDVIENIWAYIDSFWPDLSALEERTTGVKPAKVEPSPFTLPSGRQIKGGYYPLVADPDPTLNIKGQEDYIASQSLKAFTAGGKAKVSTKHGSTIERKGFGEKRVWLDLRVAFEHIDGVVRDIEMREAVADVSRIIRSEPFAKAVTRAKGGEFYQMFNAWLENTVGASRPPVTTVESVSQYFRTGASIAEMGLSVRTILMQPFGFTQSVALIGEKYAARGLIKYAGQRGKAAREVMEASAFMRNRSATFNRDVREASRWLGVSGLKNDVVTWSFKGIQLLDMAVCVPTWLGAYDKALDEGMVHEDAVDYADNIVAKSQGSGLPRNMADIQQGAVWKRMFTMFYSYFGAYYNVQADQWKQTSFKNPKQALKYAKNQIYLTIIPAIVIDALFNDLFGSDDEEEILRKVGGSLLRQLTGGVVFARDAVNALTTGFDYQTTPAGNPIKEAGNLAKQAGQGEIDLPLIKALIMFSGYMLHIPGARAGTRGASVLMDENNDFEVDEFESWWRLLVTGPERRQ